MHRQSGGQVGPPLDEPLGLQATKGIADESSRVPRSHREGVLVSRLTTAGKPQHGSQNRGVDAHEEHPSSTLNIRPESDFDGLVNR